MSPKTSLSLAIATENCPCGADNFGARNMGSPIFGTLQMYSGPRERFDPEFYEVDSNGESTGDSQGRNLT